MQTSSPEEHFEYWRKRLLACGPTDREKASLAVQRLYTYLGRDNPTIVFCRSPFQLALMPSLAVNILNSDQWALTASFLEEGPRDDHNLEIAWEEIWDELWRTIGFNLLHQMIRTLRHAEDFAHLVPALRDDLGRELLKRVKSGKFEFNEVQLHQSSYRQAWLVQEWFPNQVAKGFDKILSAQRSMTALPLLIGEPSYDEHSVDAHSLAVSLDNVLFSLLSTMGAEAVSQTRTIYPSSAIVYPAVWLSFLLRNPNMAEQVKLQASEPQKLELEICLQILESTAGIMPLQDICFVYDYPMAISTDDEFRLHSPKGPALQYSDGFQTYAWHGVMVPDYVIENPESITCAAIDMEQNAEVRRVMIERYGQARYLAESGAEIIHSDDFGTLYRKQLPGDEPLVMVKVVNSTPEPDGTFKDYFLRVPPTINTAREAVAWTFHLSEPEYEPEKET